MIGIYRKNVLVGTYCLFSPPILPVDSAQQESSLHVPRLNLDRLSTVLDCQFLVAQSLVESRQHAQRPGAFRGEFAGRFQFLDGPIRSYEVPLDQCQVDPSRQVLRVGQIAQSRMAVPQGLSIANLHVPSGCRRITSMATPSIDTGSPSGPVPVSVHRA